MSFVIWYKVEINQSAPSGGAGDILAAAASVSGLGLPISVSNDVFAGSLILDADITVTMTEGASADTFKVTLINLPTRTADLIRAVRAGIPLTMSVHLGYFDEPSTRDTDTSRVLKGRITRVTGDVGEDGLARTTLYGQEEAGYRLLKARAESDQPGAVTALTFVEDILLKKVDVPLAKGSTLPGDLTDFTAGSKSILAALSDLAESRGVAFVVRDGTAFLGASVGDPRDSAPMDFDPDTNIVSLDTVHGEDSLNQPDPPVRSTVDLTVLGHPQLRVGKVARVKKLANVPEGPWRLSYVEHSFKSAAGYTAKVRLISADPGRRAQITTGVQGAVDRVGDVIGQARDDHPAIDMGEVTTYVSGAAHKHVATMRYGQVPALSAETPSVSSPIETTQRLHNKPIASPFAFDRTGLIVPVYRKMRALLAHNRGLVNDAVVAGFVWADDPIQRRPPNEPGDYWLALPSELDGDDLPTGKGVNDLIDASGHRVIQVTGLHILVGADALPDVGTRPDPPADDTVTIEHASGTTITVNPDGAVTITTNNNAITMTNGSVSLTLDGSTVAVS
jgi:hypothetical protein